MRISIRKHNQVYLQELALQMGLSDLSETLNYLLLDIKGLGYQFGSKPAPRPQTAPIGFDASTFETFVTPAPSQECDRNYQEIDPIIARFANLIEEF
ncbi:MAG: hypothetical protein KME38_29025 [Spirirestis rafaelensis WJT71-NPBG6]|jgi:hypothetical protein|nr:hypothetical protein [Spirirestis rafaelensis WJT71-NPBG6]